MSIIINLWILNFIIWTAIMMFAKMEEEIEQDDIANLVLLTVLGPFSILLIIQYMKDQDND